MSLPTFPLPLIGLVRSPRPTRESFGKATRDVKCEVKAAKSRVDERYDVADAEFGEVLGYHLGRATV